MKDFPRASFFSVEGALAGISHQGGQVMQTPSYLSIALAIV